MNTSTVESIVNVVSSAILNGTGQWTYSGSLPPCDEIVVRQATYSSSGGVYPIYIIMSDLTSSPIAAVSPIVGFMSNPGTRIMNPRQLQSRINFQLLTCDGLTAIPGGIDYVSVSLDFIKYR